MEFLRGRDGLPGRDGVQGLPGPQGKDGFPGPPGPKSGGATYTRWGKSTCPQGEGTEMGSLEGHTTPMKEVEPITSACPRTQSTALH